MERPGRTGHLENDQDWEHVGTVRGRPRVLDRQ